MGPPLPVSNGGSGGPSPGVTVVDGMQEFNTLDRTAFKIHLNATSYRHMKYGDGIDVKVSGQTQFLFLLFSLGPIV